MRSVARRRFAGVLVTGTLAGCATPDDDGSPPDDRAGGAPDLVLRNCLQESTEVDVTVTRVETGETVHEGTHVVPPDSCSDFGDPVEVESVFDHPGEYVVRANVPGLDAARATVTLLEAETSDDTDTRAISIDEDGVTIG